MLEDKNLKKFPILIEYKGYADKLVKLNDNGQVDNRNAKNELIFKNISSYVVNGAVHYANVLLHYASYTDIISLGVTGYKDTNNEVQLEIGVYYVFKDHFVIGQEVDKYSDLSFLRKENFDKFIKKIRNIHLSTEELEERKIKREQEINASLVKLNNDIYKNEKGLSESDRVYLVASTIIATLGISDKVSPLEKAYLKSLNEIGNRDGDIVVCKIESF